MQESEDGESERSARRESEGERREEGRYVPLKLLLKEGSSGSTVDGSLGLLLGGVLDQSVSLRRKEEERKKSRSASFEVKSSSMSSGERQQSPRSKMRAFAVAPPSGTLKSQRTGTGGAEEETKANHKGELVLPSLPPSLRSS